MDSNESLRSFFLLFGLFGLAIMIFFMFCYWRIFEKAGRKGWEGIIPLYNFYVMLKFVGKPGWWLVLFFIPLVNYIFVIWTMNMLSKSFGKSEGFTVGLVLLSFIFIPILAFGSAKYQGPYGDEEAFIAYQQQNAFDLDQGRFAM